MVAFFVSGCNRIVTLAMFVEVSVKYSKSLCAPERLRLIEISINAHLNN